MSPVRVRHRGVDRVALRASEAAESLGISRDSFDRYVRDELRWLRVGRLRLVGVDELRRWADENALRIPRDIWHEEPGE